MHTPCSSLLDILPSVRGTIKIVSMDKLTWFRTGGNACVFTPEDVEDLQYFLQHTPRHIPVYPLGLGSNTLVRDSGYAGVIIRMNRLQKISVEDNYITAQSGVMDSKLAKVACIHGLSGLEFMIGIPGAVGGAVAMNAGAYGSDTKGVLVSAQGLTRAGEFVEFSTQDLGMSYRYCKQAEDIIFSEAVFQGQYAPSHDIQQRMDEIVSNRTDSQPVKSATGGSTFRNPNDAKAWELIDSVGLRGFTIGGACISDKHCNFLINTGDASTQDLEDLIHLAHDKVQSQHDIDLQLEIKIIGDVL